jgi:agmatine deiminase
MTPTFHFALLFIVFTLSISCNSNESDEGEFYFMPAEYEPHEAVWLGWEDFPPYHQPFMDVTRSLISKVPVKMIAKDGNDLKNLKIVLSENSIDTHAIAFYIIKDNRLWMRDHGAAYLINGQGDKKVADFGWTLYGNEGYLKTYFEGDMDSVKYYYQRNLGSTGEVDRIMGEQDGLSSISTDVNMEGGSIEVNGKGTLILCEAVTMQRNPEKSREYIESEFKRVLGVTNIIWMKEGLVEDPLWFNQIFDDYFGWGTYGHTDEFVRFVNDTTILLAWVDEEEKDINEFNRLNYDRMMVNLQILRNAKDQDGRSFRIIKLPLPDPIFIETTVTDQRVDWSNRADWKVPESWLPEKDMKKPGDPINMVAASSYLNYLVTNDVVLLPTYLKEGSNPQKEERVKSIFEEVFPDRELVFLEVMGLNFNGGGIHCITQQEPWVQ